MARESGKTSSGVTEECRLNVDLFSLMVANKKAMNQSQTVTPKIQKVPTVLRGDSNFVKQYEPTMVSLGPIHHHNSKYESGEGYDYKQILINDFVQASGQELDSLKQQIENIQQLRDFFETELIKKNHDDKLLASMLCEDGCAILQYIYRPPTETKYHVIAQDILLLENQIPYKVLKELMRLSNNKDQLEKSIATFIQKHANLHSQEIPHVLTDGNHVHLLDLLRKSLLGRSQAETHNKRKDLVLPSFRNVQKLKAAGIHLRRSSDWFFRNIVFSRRFHLLGRLYLPPITVDNSTRLKFLNLVAYEMCLDFKNDPGPGVTSYLLFLYSLINEAQDVKELRDAGVLYNSFGSDTELQTIFSEICAELGSDPDTYIGVREKIQEYYGTLMSKMLQFYHAYIKDSSWPLLVILAVLLDLLFSGTQTLISVKTWFSVTPAPAPAPQSHS